MLSSGKKRQFLSDVFLLLLLLQDLSNTEAGISSTPLTINAHLGELACLAINQQGTLIATASCKGTLLRIWCTLRRVQVVELRRGVDPATLYRQVLIDNHFPLVYQFNNININNNFCLQYEL